jgi:hypothetical protein
MSLGVVEELLGPVNEIFWSFIIPAIGRLIHSAIGRFGWVQTSEGETKRGRVCPDGKTLLGIE